MAATLAFLAMWGAFAFAAQSGEMNLEECPDGVCHLQLHPAMLLRQNWTQQSRQKVDDHCSEKTASDQTRVLFADCKNGVMPTVHNKPVEKARRDAQFARCLHYRRCVLKEDGDYSVQHRMPQGLKPKMYCSMASGALTDPIVRFTGTEEIQKGTKRAQDWDWLWWAARNGLGNDGSTQACKRKGLAPGCALLVNPVCARGQDQLHIHNRVLKAGWYMHETTNGKKERRDCRGGDLSRKMQQEVCSNQEYMQTFVKIDVFDLVPNCYGAKTNYARYFRNFPQVFTEAAKAPGWEQRGGITVWPCYRGALLLQEGEEEQERVSFQPNQKHTAATKQKAFNTGFTNNGIKGGASQNGKPACYDLNVPDKARTEGYVVMITSCNIEHLIFGPLR
ncbi:Prpf6 [Symbiodinium natans]|uniref:Prpf6 protein n=1 Tax=Symbiodinium natans TaxID=878477 RepID=A0A812GLJ1_9DINO|nr:Prpf6 [Symbiodinium natans]